jgi:hypothetical protein
MKIKRHLVSLAVFTLLFNQLAFFLPVKTEAALPSHSGFSFTVLAAGERSSVLAVTGLNVTTNQNGTEWYYNPDQSMGFAPNGATINQSSADLGGWSDPLRLSWHLSGGSMHGGYRAGATLGLNSSTDWSRYIYQSDNLPAYYPSGPQADVPSTSLAGWSLCYSGTYNLVVSLSSLWTSCTGNYLLLAGANHNYSPDKVDVTYAGSSILSTPGGTQLETPLIYPGDGLDFHLYESDGVTAVPWNDYLVFISDCQSGDCGTLTNPLAVPSDWGSSNHTDNTSYTVPENASDHYLAIVPADDETFAGEPGSVVYVQVTAPVDRTVSSCAELQAVNDNLHDNYTLTADLDCAATATWNEGAGFFRIGSSDTPFLGSFDGQGHSISNLHINRPDLDNVGLFGFIGEYGAVTNLNLVNVDIQGRYRVGGLVGMLSGDLLGCSSSGNVAGTRYVGGLVGYHDGNINDIFFLGAQGNAMHTLSTISKLSTGNALVTQGKEILANIKSGNLKLPKTGPGNTIIASNSTAAVSGQDSVGGLVGSNSGLIELGSATGNVTLQGVENNSGGGFVGNNSGLILGASATGNITSAGGFYLGGFSGWNDGLILMSYATGNVSGASNVGGFSGWNDGVIGIGYARGSVTGTHDLGGFAGRSEGQIVQVYSTGTVLGTGANLGGLVGYFTDNTENLFSDNSISSFWDNQTSGQSVGCGNMDCASVIFGRSSAAMKHQTTYTTELGPNTWDFDNTFGGWNINPQSNDGYPFLRVFDLDNDGSMDSVENSGPNQGDANNDGLQDSQQANVSSFINNQNNEPEVLQVPESCTITSVSTQAESGLLLQDAGFNYPAGLTNFTINCGENSHGATDNITLYFYGLDPAGLTLRKYNTTNSSYATITPVSLEQVTIGGRQAAKVVYQVTDGGPLDQDGIANGIIVDPVGLGSNVVLIPNTGLGGGL